MIVPTPAWQTIASASRMSVISVSYGVKSSQRASGQDRRRCVAVLDDELMFARNGSIASSARSKDARRCLGRSGSTERHPSQQHAVDVRRHVRRLLEGGEVAALDDVGRRLPAVSAAQSSASAVAATVSFDARTTEKSQSSFVDRYRR